MNEDDTPSTAASILYYVTTIPLGTLARAYVLRVLWDWFALPLGAPHLGAWHLTGLALLGTAALPYYKKGKDLTNRRMFDGYLDLVLAPLVVLGLGWVFHALM